MGIRENSLGGMLGHSSKWVHRAVNAERMMKPLEKLSSKIVKSSLMHAKSWLGQGAGSDKDTALSGEYLQALMNTTTERETCAAYLNVLKGLGADQTLLAERALFLQQLHKHLDSQPETKAGFNLAMKRLLFATERPMWTFYLTLGREYCMFWLRDVKAIATACRENYFHLQLPKEHPVIQLEQFEQIIQGANFTSTEKWPVKAYSEALKLSLHMDSSQIEDKLQIAKMLVYLIRDAEASSKQPFNLAVDRLFPAFSRSHARAFYSDVCNEFYHFWDGNPRALEIMLGMHATGIAKAPEERGTKGSVVNLR